MDQKSNWQLLVFGRLFKKGWKAGPVIQGGPRRLIFTCQSVWCSSSHDMSVPRHWISMVSSGMKSTSSPHVSTALCLQDVPQLLHCWSFLSVQQWIQSLSGAFPSTTTASSRGCRHNFTNSASPSELWGPGHLWSKPTGVGVEPLSSSTVLFSTVMFCFYTVFSLWRRRFMSG